MFQLMCKEPSTGWRGTKEMLLYITLQLFMFSVFTVWI